MIISAPHPFEQEIWRTAKEMGLDCQIYRPDGALPMPDDLFELVIDPEIGMKGVETRSPDKEWGGLVHREIIAGLSEPNPAYTAHNGKSELLKPKDMGIRISHGHTRTKIYVGDRIEKKRLEKHEAQLVRKIVHAFVSLALMKNRLP